MRQSHARHHSGAGMRCLHHFLAGDSKGKTLGRIGINAIRAVLCDSHGKSDERLLPLGEFARAGGRTVIFKKFIPFFLRPFSNVGKIGKIFRFILTHTKPPQILLVIRAM